MGKHNARTRLRTGRPVARRRRTTAGTAAALLLAALVTGWPGASAATPPTGEVYVAGFGDGGVAQFGTYAGGYAIPMTYPVAPAPGAPSSVAMPSSGKYVYTHDCRSGDVRQFTVDSAGLLIGTLVPMLPPLVGTYQCTDSYPHPGRTIAVTKSGTFVLVAATDPANHQNAVFSLKAGSTGALTQVSQLDVASPSFDSVAVAPNNKFVYAVDISGTITQLTLSTAGVLSAPHTFTTDPGATDAQVTPSGKNLLVASFVTNTVYNYAINATTGALTLVGTIFAGVQPAQLTVAPNGKAVYVANYGDDTISQFTLSTTGVLAAMSPPNVAAGSQPVSIGVNATSKYLYVVNSGDQTLGAYSINATSQLTALNTAPAGNQPWGLAVRK